MFTFSGPKSNAADHASPKITTRITKALSAFNGPEKGEHARPEAELEEVADDTRSIFDSPARDFDTDEFGISEHMGRRTIDMRFVAVPAAAVFLVGAIAVSVVGGTQSVTQSTQSDTVVQTAVYSEDEDTLVQAVEDTSAASDEDADAEDAGSEETDSEDSGTTEVDDEDVVVDASDDTVYLVVGEDIEAGTWRFVCSTTSSSLKGYLAVYSDEEATELLANDSFSGVSYITLEDGQYLRVSRAKVVAVNDELAAAGTDNDESTYLVGTDLDEGTITLVKTGDEDYANYVLWSSTDAESRSVVASGDFESTLTLTVEEGQLLTLEEATFEE